MSTDKVYHPIAEINQLNRHPITITTTTTTMQNLIYVASIKPMQIVKRIYQIRMLQNLEEDEEGGDEEILPLLPKRWDVIL